jgi:hypothetical protein
VPCPDSAVSKGEGTSSIEHSLGFARLQTESTSADEKASRSFSSDGKSARVSSLALLERLIRGTSILVAAFLLLSEAERPLACNSRKLSSQSLYSEALHDALEYKGTTYFNCQE